VKATNWEFKNRALVFGLIFGVTFPLYALDHQNATGALANWLAPRLRMNAGLVARLLFAFAALLLATAALIRTWASSYLHASVVYAPEVKTDSLVGDGPYRRVRNPLYFANVLMVIGMGALMSRTGFFVAVLAMLVFCYRLIFREEDELQASQGARYQGYRRAVPRLWPSLQPRIVSAGQPANWAAGFKAESWYWGFAAGLVVCYNPEPQAVFRDTSGKPCLVLGVFARPPKKVKPRRPPFTRTIGQVCRERPQRVISGFLNN
jgi:protein-S-isoprenylcysteine O-methyltransferase Ste14